MTVDIAQTRTEVGNYCFELSAVLPVEAGVCSARARGAQPAATSRRSIRPLHSHPVLPETLSLLLFKVYTDKNASEIEIYLDALIKENELYSRMPAFQGRQLRFAYFGGGTRRTSARNSCIISSMV